MEKVSLKSVTEEKDLGVVIDKKLSWLPHVKKISNRANYKRQFLQRNLRSCKGKTKLQCYKTYVRPVLEYASPVWDTNNKKVIENIESVQRKAIRFIMNDYKQDSSVTKMMKQLNMDPLDIRRKVKKLKLLQSILSQKVFLPNYVKPIRARDQIKLKPIYARIQS